MESTKTQTNLLNAAVVAKGDLAYHTRTIKKGDLGVIVQLSGLVDIPMIKWQDGFRSYCSWEQIEVVGQ